MKKLILSAKKVQKTFANNGEQVHVLSNVNLDIYEGDFTVIMGSSGAGKSTLLYALSGMDKATSGQVIYYKDGKESDVVGMKEKELAVLRAKEFGFVFQQMHLVSNLSLLENVLVTGYLNKEKSPAKTKEKAKALLERMNLFKVMDHLPSKVSGGEQQRCAIVFADEPTGALNRKNTTEVLDLLTQLNEEGQSIVMVTHDLKAALRGNRLIYLDDSNIVGELELTRYGEKDGKGERLQDDKVRETQINAWLESLNW